jgi:hypothetical protein
LYRRRGKTVEPFFERFKALVDLGARTCHHGLDNNRTMILAAIFNLFSTRKIEEKPAYMHLNPVRAGLVRHA